MRGFTAAGRPAGDRAVGRLLSWSARVPLEPIRWAVTQGPWYDNNLAVLELAPGGVRMWWNAGTWSTATPNGPC